ncbi:MAG: PEGA domain-containing protein [Pseudomonadota bacterium]
MQHISTRFTAGCWNRFWEHKQTALSFVCFCLGIVLLLTPTLTSAKAQTNESILQNGIEEYRAGHFKQSIKTLNRMIGKTKDNQLLIQANLHLGLAYCAIKQNDDAKDAFKHVLLLDPSYALDMSRTDGTALALFDQARNSISGELIVRADKENCTVNIDDTQTASVPFKGTLSVGRHRVFVQTTDGLHAIENEIVIHADKTYTLEAKLETLGGKLNVATNPEGAKVLIGKRWVGTAPLFDFRLAPGMHKVSLVLEGYKVWTETVSVKTGEVFSIYATLDPLAISQSKKKTPTQPAIKRIDQLWPWVIGGTAVAATGLGVVFSFTARSAWNEYQDQAKNINIAAYESKQATVATHATVANISFALAGTLAVTAAVVFFLDLPEPEEQGPNFSIGPASLVVDYRF